MGANQSRTPSEQATTTLIERTLLERLRALETKDADEEYVHVNEKQAPAFKAPWTSLSTSDVKHWEHELLQQPKNRLALSALSSADPKAVLSQRSTIMHDPQIFNVKIPFEGAPIANQRASGRCWLFAATNVFRVALMKRHNLASFELSQAYLFFYDKLEKANYFLEQILDTTDQDLDGRVVQSLIAGAISDGGQWDMVYNLVKKYGLVPQVLYPDSWSAMNSAAINSLIKTKLREDALVLRRMVSDGQEPKDISAAKEHMMKEIHLILTLTLGPPPAPNTEFTWQYIDAAGSPHEMKSTPVDFAEELNEKRAVRITGSRVHDMFSLVNDPRHAYNTLLTVSRLGNIVGGRPITYVNVSMGVMKDACIAMLRAGLPVFFGSDVGKYSDRSSGVMDESLVDYELGFNVRLGMSKKQRLQTGESAMTHAMVLTAVHVGEDGKAVRWRVQNSWGKDVGDEGWFVMSDGWMSEFCYQAVVEPRFVSKEVRDVLGTKATVLPLWDPMGALA